MIPSKAERIVNRFPHSVTGKFRGQNWAEADERLALERLKTEFMAGPKELSEARRLASRLNQPHDAEVLRKFLVLLERHGLAKVRRAVSITARHYCFGGLAAKGLVEAARFKHHFALRHVHHTAGILRNWSQGIRK
jgi:hypothetical protein